MEETTPEDLAHENLDLVYKFAYSKQDRQFSPEELIGPSYIALREAACLYDDKYKAKVKFRTFAWYKMRQHHFLFKRNIYRVGIFQSPTLQRKGRQIEREYDFDFEVKLEAKYYDIEFRMDAENLKKMLAKIPLWDRHIIRLRFFEDYQFQEIADIYGINQATAFKWLKKSLTKLALVSKYNS